MDNANVCPELNTSMYEVEFPDGDIRPYDTNVIADIRSTQVNPDGQHYVMFELIIDHHVDNSIALNKENTYHFMNG